MACEVHNKEINSQCAETFGTPLVHCTSEYILCILKERETTWFNRQQLFQPLDRFHQV